MSAQYIYHTALPLSPGVSVLRLQFSESHPFWEESCTTQRASSSSVSTSWGPIVRTIGADSGSFIHVTVAGQRIVAVCDNNTVNVYDVVTGVLKLSLNAPQQVTKAEGSPDGFVPFFGHQKAREITLWDTRTGGLIYIFTTAFEISDIAVSLKGNYLASCSFDGTFQVWEVESRRGSSCLFGQQVLCMYWLEPEDRAALAFEGTVVILEVATRRTLHTINVGENVQAIVFSADERQSAISVASGIENMIENTIVIIDTGICLTQESTPPLRDVSCLTFSDNGDRVICATKTGDLWSYTPTFSSDWDNHLIRLGTIHSISLLRNGHLVVNSGGSIQLLRPAPTRTRK